MNLRLLHRLYPVVSSRGAVGALLVTISLATAVNAANAQTAPSLGEGSNFAILGGASVSNTGSSLITGDLGVDPGTAITGFPPGKTRRAVFHAADTTAAKAKTDVTTAYNQLANETCGTSYVAPTDLGGKTLPPGVYCFSSSAQLTGVLSLDGGGNPNSVWVFKIGSTLTTASSSSVKLINSAQEHNIFWQVGSSATLGTGSTFQGSILALTSITLTTDVTLAGRALALTGSVTMDTDNVSACVCILPYDAITPTITNTILVAPAVNGVAGSVFGATLSPDGKSVWVAGYNGIIKPGFVSLVDVASEKVGSSVTVGAGPADIAFTSTGARAYVTNYDGASFSQVSASPLKVIKTINLNTVPETLPFGIIVPKAGRLLVTAQGDGNVVTEMNTSYPISLVQAISIPGPSGRPALVPATAIHYGGQVLVPTFVTGTASNAGHPVLNIVNPSSAQVSAHITLWSSRATPEAVVVSPDGNYAYVSLFDSNGGSGGVWVVSLATLTTKTVILTCDPANFGEAISADGKYLLVAGFLENQVALIDTATDTVDVIINAGHQPNAIVLASGDSKAFFTNQTDGTVSVVSFTPSL